MLIKTLPVGQLETNCYIVTNEATLECVIIDPGDESNTILNYLEDNRLSCRAVFLTHGHFDHTGAVEAIVEELSVPVYMHEADLPSPGISQHFRFALPKGGKTYADNERLEIAGLTFDIISTPGHTPGSVTIRCENALFTGDTLFKGSCGRVDLPGGDMQQELRSIKRICELEGDYELYPGHMDSSTLEMERNFNYYCREAMNKY